MNRIANLSVLAGIAFLVADSGVWGQPPAQGSHAVLWYLSHAPIRDRALPVRNGCMGAMVLGGANAGKNNGDEQFSSQNAILPDGLQASGADEHLQLNESSLWQGSRMNRLNPEAHEAVPEVRKLLLEWPGLDGAVRLIPPAGQASVAVHNSAGGIIARRTDRTIRTQTRNLVHHPYPMTLQGSRIPRFHGRRL